MIVQKRAAAYVPSASHKPQSKRPKHRRRTAVAVLAGLFDPPLRRRDLLTGTFNINLSGNRFQGGPEILSHCRCDIQSLSNLAGGGDHAPRRSTLTKQHSIAPGRDTELGNSGGVIDTQKNYSREPRDSVERRENAYAPVYSTMSSEAAPSAESGRQSHSNFNPSYSEHIPPVHDPYSNQVENVPTLPFPSQRIPLVPSIQSPRSINSPIHSSSFVSFGFSHGSDIASPPTPSRSISSYTSGAPSLRPHTPDDGDYLSLNLSGDGAHGTGAKHSPLGKINEYDGTPQKTIYGLSTPDPLSDSALNTERSSINRHSSVFPSRTRSPISSQRDPSMNGIYDTQANSGHPSSGTICSNPAPRSVDQRLRFSGTIEQITAKNPQTVPNPQPSSPSQSIISHRRNALSLAGLLSPVSAPYGSPKSFPFSLSPAVPTILSQPGASTEAKEHLDKEGRNSHLPTPRMPTRARTLPASQPSTIPLLNSAGMNTGPIMPPVRHPPLPVLAPLEKSLLDVEMEEKSDINSESFQSSCYPSPASHASPTLAFAKPRGTPESSGTAVEEDAVALSKVEKTNINEAADIVMDDFDELRCSPQPLTPSDTVSPKEEEGVRDMSMSASDQSDEEGQDLLPIPLKKRGKHSRAKVIMSDDEERGDEATSSTSLKTNPLPSKSSPKLKRNVGKRRIRSKMVPSHISIPTSGTNSVDASKSTLPSAVTVMSPTSSLVGRQLQDQSITSSKVPGRKRLAAKKGWKGWIEVDVDDVPPPPKQFKLELLPPGERKTRSGKQFDG